VHWAKFCRKLTTLIVSVTLLCNVCKKLYIIKKNQNMYDFVKYRLDGMIILSVSPKPINTSKEVYLYINVVYNERLFTIGFQMMWQIIIP